MSNKIKTIKELKKSGYISLDIKEEMITQHINMNTKWS